MDYNRLIQKRYVIQRPHESIISNVRKYLEESVCCTQSQARRRNFYGISGVQLMARKRAEGRNLFRSHCASSSNSWRRNTNESIQNTARSCHSHASRSTQPHVSSTHIHSHTHTDIKYTHTNYTQAL